jgi:hypothetical protein
MDQENMFHEINPADGTYNVYGVAASQKSRRNRPAAGLALTSPPNFFMFSHRAKNLMVLTRPFIFTSGSMILT